MEGKNKEKVAPLTEHFEELRRRLVFSLIAVILASIVTFMYVDIIRETITKPAGIPLVFITPAEAFMTNIKIALIAGFLLALPVILFQIWSFLLPGLKSTEKRNIFLFALASFFFFAVGVIFAFYVIIPISIRFFLGFASEDLTPMLSFGNYISYVSGIVFAFGGVFQLPIVVFILAKLGLVTSDFLKKSRVYAVMLIFIVAAVITPPDVFSQVLMAVPMILLYEISILTAKMVGK
ncbi:MAG: twin-arginine translocase subunit TatC [Candidatus Syntrophonatronum acetioxidans]|uniref:Sec-independent protein translocase protein TatC n=1 Tax=Candidatus Syntrophonatronum acetioxidans TaxID=1795816 RepID=A0A424YIM3_9FIRM|nr:MAG: twin-arginine translocase subunit TatC [Candidatus Syntrophonatronum acetioxidans]